MEKVLSKGKWDSMEVSYQGNASMECLLHITPFSGNRVPCTEPCSSAIKGTLFVGIRYTENHMPRFQPSRCFLSLNFFPS